MSLATKVVGTHLDLSKNEIRNLALENLSSDPTGYAGRTYWNTTSKKIRVYDGTSWGDAGGASTDIIATQSFGLG